MRIDPITGKPVPGPEDDPVALQAARDAAAAGLPPLPPEPGGQTHGAPDPFALAPPAPPPSPIDSRPVQWGRPELAPPPDAPPAAAPAPPPSAAPAVAPGPSGVEASKTETERTVLSPTSKAALAAARTASQREGTALERQAAAGKAKGASDLQQQQAESSIEADRAAAEAKQAERDLAAEQAAQAAHAKALADANARIAAAQKKADEDFAKSQKSYWADKSTGFKVIAALLQGASVKDSYILGEDPNNNPVMTKIRDAVAADKAKKLAQYKRSEEYLAEAKKGPEEARRALLDARTDIEAQSNRALTVMKAKAEAQLKTSKKIDPQRFKVLSDAMMADSDAKLAEETQRLADRNLTREAVTNAKVTTTKATTPTEKAGTDTLVYGEGGKPIARTRTAKEAEAANKANATFRQLDGLLAALEESYRTNGKAYNPFSQTYQDQKTLQAQADIAYKNVAQLGALSGSDNKLIANAIGGAWTGDQGVKKSRAAREAMARGHAATLDTLGLPGKQLVGQLRAGGGEQASGAADISVSRLRVALSNAAKAGDKAAVAAIRKELAARGER
jgi:hypothetical protein